MNINVRLAVLSLAACGLGGCETTSIFRGDPDEEAPAAGGFTESASPLAGAEFDGLWARAEHVLAMEGYALDRSRTDYAKRTMVTHWDTMLAPTRFEGRRNRTWVRIRETSPGGFVVGVAVQNQHNVDIDAPSEPSQAQWEEIAGNAARAGVILWKIESGLRPEGSTETR